MRKSFVITKSGKLYIKRRWTGLPHFKEQRVCAILQQSYAPQASGWKTETKQIQIYTKRE